MADFAEIRIIHCTTLTQVLYDRIAHRAEHDLHRRAHYSEGMLAEIAAGTRTAASFIPVNMDVEQMTVDTTGGYEPGLDASHGLSPRPASGLAEPDSLIVGVPTCEFAYSLPLWDHRRGRPHSSTMPLSTG
ncbi:hypothetical protein AB0I35_12935 [Nocardia sp. NPDC050378]|uniref:hypothetical protein n=1 Tax=Nocardia sp. NPDC050378 TaxID=3155400 RepID=UPI0033DF3122